MRLVQITPGAGGMYCGNCFRDNALVAALRRQGHDTLMVPLYLPMTLDEAPTSGDSPTFFGGINVYLDQKLPFHRRAPRWFRALFDAPALLKWAAGKAAKTRAEDVGELNLSMLRGEEGCQRRDLEELVGWLRGQPRPDAVFLSNALLAGFARQLKEQLQTRVIVFLQSEESFLDSMPEPWRSRSWETLAARGQEVDAWISPSRYFADRMGERLGIPSSRVHVVPNGISLAGYDRLPPRAARQPGDPLALGFFARQGPDKGLDLVVDAFLELRRRGRVPRLSLRVGGGCGPGDQPFVDAQREKLRRAGVIADATFHPNLSRDEKIAFYAACDVLSVPARSSEAFGLYVIEALAAGTPLVQPATATFPELLAATGGGTLATANTPSALANALEPLLLDPARLRRLGDAGQAAVRERFTDATMARAVADTTREVLAGTRAAPAPRPARPG